MERSPQVRRRGNANSFEEKRKIDFDSDEIKQPLTIEESILHHVLRLMKKEMPDNVKMLAQYFQFFVNYSSIGRHEVC